MKVGDIINTPNGKGRIVFKEDFERCPRFCVELENNPFKHPVACYFIDELKLLIKLLFSLE